MIQLENHISSASLNVFQNDYIPTPEMLIGHYAHELDQILLTPRAGWLLRDIPPELAETTSAHCSKVAIATHLILSSVCYPIDKKHVSKLVFTAGLHDVGERQWIDYTPHDLKNGVVTKQQKYQEEHRNLQRYTQEFQDPLPELLWLELENNVYNKHYKLIHELDKLDAGVMALNYKEHGYDVDEFFEYTESKLSNSLLQFAFSWLQRREFPHIDYFYQYCVFLYFDGMLHKIRRELEEYK